MRKNHLTLQIFSLIVLNDMVDTVAQLIMTKGLAHSGISSINFGNFFEFAAKNASSALICLGILVYVLNFFIWIVVLYKVDLSIAMPVGSMSYILVPFAAAFFLREHVGVVSWAGVLCIVLGVHFVSRSKKLSKEA